LDLLRLVSVSQSREGLLIVISSGGNSADHEGL
jgi:hypothetical protein